MTIRYTTDIVFDGHTEIAQADEFEKQNDMDEWKKYEASSFIMFRKVEETFCVVR